MVWASVVVVVVVVVAAVVVVGASVVVVVVAGIVDKLVVTAVTRRFLSTISCALYWLQLSLLQQPFRQLLKSNWLIKRYNIETRLFFVTTQMLTHYIPLNKVVKCCSTQLPDG